VSAAIVGVIDAADVVDPGAVVDVVDVEMLELVSRSSDDDIEVEVIVGVISPEFVCSVVVEVASVVVFRSVVSDVDDGVD